MKRGRFQRLNIRSMRLIQAFWQQLTWGDRALILGILVASASFIPWLQSGRPGQAAIVRLENEVVATLSLKKEVTYSVWGPLGETVVQVKGGKVRVLSDPGPQQLCVRQGWISRAGDMLVCLPNRVMVQIPGTPAVDGVVK